MNLIKRSVLIITLAITPYSFGLAHGGHSGAAPAAFGGPHDTSAAVTTTGTLPPPSSISMTTVTAEIAQLKNQESNTLAAQQAATINAVSLQAKDTASQAKEMEKGASNMMAGAAAGLAVSVATTAVSVGSVGEASKSATESESTEGQ